MARPPQRAFLKAEWRNLVMFNYAVDPALLRPFVARGTELDAWQGQYFVSLVGFLFAKTRVLGIPVPWRRAHASSLRRTEKQWSAINGAVPMAGLIPVDVADRRPRQ